MKITIESTTKTVVIANRVGDEGIQCRVWEGVTENGVRIQCLIPRIAVDKNQDVSQFERELQECKAPSLDLNMFPMRMIL